MIAASGVMMLCFVTLVSGSAAMAGQLVGMTQDVLMVTRLARLARPMWDLLNTLATTTERKAGFRSIGDKGHLPICSKLQAKPVGFERDTNVVARGINRLIWCHLLKPL